MAARFSESPHPLSPEGYWAEVRVPFAGPRPALFLDRDGVVVEDSHYLNRAEDVRLIAGAAKTIRTANDQGVPVVIVTNQAGIGYGYYGWDAFALVQEKVIADIHDASGGTVNAVFACPFHAKGKPPYQHPNPPCRKPNPGMIEAAARMMALDLGRSWIIGDKDIDMAAGRAAGLEGGVHVASGHGGDAGEREKALAIATDHFRVLGADGIGDAPDLISILKKA